MNEQEKAIVRADLAEIASRMEELRFVESWWAGLSEMNRNEFKLFAGAVTAYQNQARLLTESPRG